MSGRLTNIASRHLRVSAVVAAILVVFTTSASFVDQADGVTESVPQARGAVALTFDDGPDPRYTPHVLDTLAEHGARATFFVVGESAKRHPELIARMLDEGHEVAHHTHTHPHVERIDAIELARQMDECLTVLSGYGIKPQWYRPPRKQLTYAQLEAAERRGMRVATWTRCIERARFVSGWHAASTLAVETREGDIVLAHDGRTDRSRTIEALPLYLSAMRDRGIDVVTLSELHRRARR